MLVAVYKNVLSDPEPEPVTALVDSWQREVVVPMQVGGESPRSSATSGALMRSSTFAARPTNAF